MGPERLQHRLRRLPDPLRSAHRPRRPAAVVRRRRRRVHRRVRAVRRSRPSVELLIVARVFQAFGAAMLVPASLALVIAAFPAERRAHAIGVWGASAAVAAGRRSTHRRGARRAGRLALGLPRQPALRPRRGVGGAARPGREPGTGSADDARPASAPPCSSRRLRCSTSASSRAPTGAGPAAQVLGSFAARPWLWCCSCSARDGTARRCSTRCCCACARSTSGPPQRSSPASASTPTC